MPSEDQLKSQMQAAIAAKKQATTASRSDEPEDAAQTSASNGSSKPSSKKTPTDPSSTKKVTAPAPTKIKTAHPAIFQPSISSATPNQQKVIDPDPAVSSDAELTRSFFGRPIRVAIYEKQVYFAVNDVLNVSDDPDKHDRYEKLYSDTPNENFLKNTIQRMRFPSPNGGHDKLDAATAENLIKIIQKLELKFPEPIEKWLISITDSLIVLL